MNAGSYGGQMSDVVRGVSYLDPRGDLVTRAVEPRLFPPFPLHAR